MPAPQQELGGAVPDGDDDFVARVEGVERGAEEARETEVADADRARGGEHDVGGLEIAVEHPVAVEVVEAVEELEQGRFDHGRGIGVLLAPAEGAGLVVGAEGWCCCCCCDAPTPPPLPPALPWEWCWMICKRSCSQYSNTMKMHLSSRMISTRWMMFGWESSEQRDISRTADWEIPVYWAASPSLSGLNLERSGFRF